MGPGSEPSTAGQAFFFWQGPEEATGSGSGFPQRPRQTRARESRKGQQVRLHETARERGHSRHVLNGLRSVLPEGLMGQELSPQQKGSHLMLEIWRSSHLVILASFNLVLKIPERSTSADLVLEIPEGVGWS